MVVRCEDISDIGAEEVLTYYGKPISLAEYYSPSFQLNDLQYKPLPSYLYYLLTRDIICK
jgi:hypothetical protein